MARMRTIKPEAFSSETLANISIPARWTFAGLWTYADDEGRGRADARLIKAAIWPLDDEITSKDVAAHLDEMEQWWLICRYSVLGKSYLHVVNFAEHQRPNRPLPSKLPPCSRRTHGGLTEDGGSPQTGPSGAPQNGAGSAGSAAGGAESGESGNPHAMAAVSAGQAGLTEHAVSPHGDSSQILSGMPTTTTTNVKGDGVVGVVVAPSAAAESTPPGAALSITQRSKRITDTYAEAEPMCKWPAVNGVVIKAIKSERYGDDEIQSALLRMASENRSVTVDSLRTELGGLPPIVDRRQQITDQKFDRAMERARARDAQEASQ